MHIISLRLHAAKQLNIITNFRIAVGKIHSIIFTTLKNQEKIHYIPSILLNDAHGHLFESSQFAWEIKVTTILYFAEEECQRLNDLVDN